MTSKLTIEQAKRLRNDFECWQQDYDPKDDKEQYDMFGRGMAAMDMLIAGMYQEPVAWIVHARTGDQLTTDGSYVANAEGILGLHSTPLYRHAQQPVVQPSEFIPKNLDKALGVVGMALPESKEEFNLQSERWIQRLIDRVIRYADEFKEQPAPVVPDALADAFIAAIEKEQDRLHEEDYLMDSKDCIDVIREEVQRLNVNRTTMLNGGKS